MIAFLLAVALWPFDFHAANGATWIAQANGIRFQGRGIAYSQGPWLDGLPASPYSPQDSLSLELWFRPLGDSKDDIQQILSLGNDDQQSLGVGQWGSALVLRFPCAAPSRAQGCELDLPLKVRKLTLLTIMSGPDGTSTYVNGVQQSATAARLLTRQTISGTLVIGNAPPGGKSWQGDLEGLALYKGYLAPDQALINYRAWVAAGDPRSGGNQDLTALYLFDERNGVMACSRAGQAPCLQVPQRFRVLQRQVLIWPWDGLALNFSHLEDLVLNIAGFVPLGLLLGAYLCLSRPWPPGRSILITTLLGGCLSLTIELLQSYLPSRSSNWDDLVSNSLGTLAGAVLLQHLCLSFRRALPLPRDQRTVATR